MSRVWSFECAWRSNFCMESNSCEFIRTRFFTQSQRGVTFSILNPPVPTRWNEFMISLKKKIPDVLVQDNKGILSGFPRLKIKGSTLSFCCFLCTSILWQLCHRFHICDEFYLHVKLHISVMYVLQGALQKNFTLLLMPSWNKATKAARSDAVFSQILPKSHYILGRRGTAA